MKLKNYTKLIAVYAVHLLSMVLGVKVIYHVRKLSTDYKRSETRGVSVASFDSPVDALNHIQKVVQDVKQNSLYFILAEARFALTPIDGEDEAPGNQEAGTEEGAGLRSGVHPAAETSPEPGRVFQDRSEGEELPDASPGRDD